jgi:hypothetical protein
MNTGRERFRNVWSWRIKRNYYETWLGITKITVKASVSAADRTAMNRSGYLLNTRLQLYRYTKQLGKATSDVLEVWDTKDDRLAPGLQKSDPPRLPLLRSTRMYIYVSAGRTLWAVGSHSTFDWFAVCMQDKRAILRYFLNSTASHC